MWKAFHHPDISLPVVRRRIGLELLELLEVLGDVAVHGAWAFLQNRTAPNPRALEQATRRLAGQGLLVQRKGLDTPVLKLSDKGESVLADYFRPEKYWNGKWGGIWYLLMYDIPEKDRPYRNVMRQFLKSQRMGCFQKSVWVSSRDIRAGYADLDEAAALGAFACLFEARTVLGMRAEQVVWESWDMDKLYEVQKRYCEVNAQNLEMLEQDISYDLETLMQFAAQALDAYRSAFALDPLLQEELLPRDYKGREAHALHCAIAEALRRKLKDVNPN
jgi:phenylacetic acid degradation operon negative regulatory protein